MPSIKVECFQEIGNRTTQEDFYYIDPLYRFFILCDGAGGHADGALASQVVTKSISNWIHAHFVSISDDTNWNLLSQYVHQSLSSSREHSKATKLMASTAVIVINKNEKWYVLHVGDSRCYHIQGKTKSFWRTKDHSLVQELYEAGVITQTQMTNHPKKNVITRAFQFGENLDAPSFDCSVLENLQQGDFVVLCSDGVVEAYPGDSIVDVFYKTQTSVTETTHTIKAKCKKISVDNSTGIIIRV